ncbi:hypothetical protein [Mycolicibacterium goodii]|uniref:Secreted protein n=1 Tax=Mycolicibacterium goodii TaxID=134601 RepID=A0ABS6HQB7_MYCGD|nr:hypothetical protein [Mycolicibacterium goodii]MBU8824403.1 hypothetical protein [Mycolicibacterium goodii]MBU8838424.1 hypothetical protein [Mycolicibacterium goodii]
MVLLAFFVVVEVGVSGPRRVVVHSGFGGRSAVRTQILGAVVVNEAVVIELVAVELVDVRPGEGLSACCGSTGCCGPGGARWRWHYASSGLLPPRLVAFSCSAIHRSISDLR